ncbi:hypothetical protein KJE20_14430 [Pyrenophora tritici-repentis]|nr:hypothetical protein KJE20_14430 [Pyrenophora tritici-repentis]
MSSPSQNQNALLLLVQQLQQELQNQRSEITSLRDSVAQLQLQLQSRQHPNDAQTRVRARLPDPPKFDGKPHTLRTWLPSIRAKLRSDQLIGADAFDYVWDRLEQPQQASILHLREQSEELSEWDPEQIFSFFQRLCHNPREQQEAIQRFSQIRQKDDESLIAYLARFERLSFEAKASSWPDISRITTLHRGLRQSLRQKLEESNDSLFSLTYDQYVETMQSAERRSKRFQTSQPSQPSQPSQSSQPNRSRFSQQMDIDSIRVNVARPARLSRSRSSSTSSSASADRREVLPRVSFSQTSQTSQPSPAKN